MRHEPTLRSDAASPSAQQPGKRLNNEATTGGKNDMAESVYKVIELVGTSTESWEKAARAAVERASQSLRDLRVAEVVELDMQITDGKVEAYRAKLKVSFKFEGQQ
jgi:dodecin